MRKTIIQLFIFLFISISVFPRQQEIDTITNRLINKYTTRSYDPISLDKYYTEMSIDGSWADIDYDAVTGGYQAGSHLNRLIDMTIAYKQPGSKYTRSKELLKKILSGVDFFFNKKPVSTNWWYMDIGAPQKYMVILILLKDKVDKDKLHHYASYLEDKTGNAGHKGKNRTWVSEITIYKGCIEDNFDLIETGFKSIASTIKIVDYNEIEGIKIDNSIHQHRPQLYSGGYGMSFMNDLAEYIYLAHSTVFAQLFTEDKMRIIRSTMLEGQQLFGYRKSFDFGTVGRNISRENGIKNIAPEILDLMMAIDPLSAPDYKNWQKHIDGAPYAKPGNKYFWKSDIMTHHGENYYLSAKVISTRTNGTEMLNGENLKGYYLPLGATNIMTTGNEYDNIFPVWDWTRIPGTTSVTTPSAASLSWYHFGSNKFAGGASNGKHGCIAFEHIYNGVQAKKAYFFINNAMLCLGSDISAYKTNNVVTSVNQCFATGDIYFSKDGFVQKLLSEKQDFDNISWVYHNNVGYIFPDGGRIVLEKKEQSGSWSLIRENGSNESLSHDIFSLWIDHSYRPQNDTYSYIVIPDKSLDEIEKITKSNGYKIIKNDSNIQAVKNEQTNTYACIFYKPETIYFNEDLEITVDKAAIILVEMAGADYQISVADPFYCEKEIKMTINRKLSGKRKNGNKSLNTIICFELPQGEYLGSTITKIIKL
ncbi:polysaccharide lyase family 8 super-sandwich domain-containing protein [Dysgonomonas sp. 520]|uniref:polysaccharide lyase family 8 super-sandwich domain-containing protein n=1 Tax=Dysgonomonas sp. 520 TaxID=2302931 RepID=UPI0013CF5760|nr:polysaccharide lyase family 8 super-sandwich domain-containing protein [Dysgonomonas sp. 520]NDW11146.1 hypothetical protein [Dysgonomonas sp. 520]